MREARPADAHLGVLHDTALESNLDRLLLELPVAHARQQPQEPALVLRHDPAPFVDERPPLRRAEALLLLEGVPAAQRELFLVRCLSWDDAGERLAREES